MGRVEGRCEARIAPNFEAEDSEYSSIYLLPGVGSASRDHDATSCMPTSLRRMPQPVAYANYWGLCFTSSTWCKADLPERFVWVESDHELLTYPRCINEAWRVKKSTLLSPYPNTLISWYPDTRPQQPHITTGALYPHRLRSCSSWLHISRQGGVSQGEEAREQDIHLLETCLPASHSSPAPAKEIKLSLLNMLR